MGDHARSEIAAKVSGSCTRRTRCSGTAAAGSASPIPRSRDAGARHHRGGLHRQEGGRRRAARDHDPAGRRREGAGATRRRSCVAWPRRSSPSRGVTRRLPGRHDDRDPAGGAHRRPDRRGRRVLQLRHQRPDADDLRLQPRRRRQVPPAVRLEEKKIWPADPFQTLDQDGVGELIKMGVERGRETRRDLKIGICGEHGGEPERRSSSATASA